jgi:hypothetical protein
MLRSTKASLVALAALSCSSSALGQFRPREPTDVYIRRLAGLPAASAKGQISIIDVGHDPLSTMLRIVGNRTSSGWSVSYACANSPRCAQGADHLAKSYTLSSAASVEVDAILESLSRRRAGRATAKDRSSWWSAACCDRLQRLQTTISSCRHVG